jgi:hypothetical protein
MLEGYQIVDLAVTLIMGAAVVLVAYSPLPRALGQALAHRLMHGKTAPPSPEGETAQMAELSGEVAALREQLDATLDRLDFAERLLAQAREKGQLGPGSGP